MKARVCHMTSVHPADDIRIFHKQCTSLAEHGYEVHLVAPGSLGIANNGVIHHEIPVFSQENRLKRMIFRAWRTYQLAKQTEAVLFHFHDPELLPYGLLLKWQGKIVIYDAHEDLPRDVLTKGWIPSYFRTMISWTIEKVENFIARRLTMVVAATPFISERFKSVGANAIDIKNYPRIAEFTTSSSTPVVKSDPPAVCYVGMITKDRGIVEMLKAIETLDIRLILAGRFINKETEVLARSLPGWSKVDYRGVVSRQEIRRIFEESVAGLCVLHPTLSYADSLPIKLFEYMAYGLPVIVSNFTLWKSIVEVAHCGLCVDPLDVTAIERGLVNFLRNKAQLKLMGKLGQEKIVDGYNWEVEVKNLADSYELVLINNRL